MIFWIILALLIFLGYGVHSFIWDKRYNLPPGPPPLPYLGSIRPHLANVPMSDLMKLHSKTYGNVFTFYLCKNRFVVLGDAKIIREVLVGQGDIFNGRIDQKLPGFESIPPGIVSASNDDWRNKRRFGMRAMRDFGMGKDAIVVNIHDEADNLLPAIAEKDGKPFNIKRLLSYAVSNVINSLVFGKRFSYDDAKLLEILHLLDRLVAASPAESAMFFMFPVIKYILVPSQAKEFLKFKALIEDVLAKGIKANRLDFDKDNIRDFPDLFIKAEMENDAIDFDSFLHVCQDMFVAGTETTTTALSWTMLYLTTFPDIQQKCHEAIDAAIDTDRLPSPKDRPNLVYIDAVMCEILRHTSFIPFGLFHSNLHKKATIQGYEIPTDTAIMYNVKAVHYDSSYWKNPETFDPDRWISDDGKLLIHSTHFMAFGLGPRVCLGEALARVEYFIFLVAMLQRYSFKLEKDVGLEPHDSTGIITGPPDFEVIAISRT